MLIDTTAESSSLDPFSYFPMLVSAYPWLVSFMDVNIYNCACVLFFFVSQFLLHM